MAEKKIGGLLPQTCMPSFYDIYMKCDLEKWVYNGSESVTFTVEQETEEIVMNSHNLNITSVKFAPFFSICACPDGLEELDDSEDEDDAEWSPCSAVSPSKIVYYEENTQVKFVFSKPIPRGIHAIHIEFDGKINESMIGFYRSPYTTKVGDDIVEHKLAGTQMESAYCRDVFPCWDEPSFKAKFRLTLSVLKDFIAVSNMPVESDVDDGAYRTVTFETTPLMSSYLVCWLVGELDMIEETFMRRSSEHVDTKEEIPFLVRVFTPVGRTEEGKVALQTTIDVVMFFESFYGIDYALPKLDLAAIPAFSAGAMENFGLMTFRETTLLVSNTNTSEAAMQRICYVIAHEIAHQWFGNLVTMKWWNDLWLNEGFATYMGYAATCALHPEWSTWENFFNDNASIAYSIDSLRETHPINVTVSSIREIEEIFDSITYRKGACIVRALAEWLGPKLWKKGINTYLKTHKYGNTTTSDLFDALDKVRIDDQTERDEYVKESFVHVSYLMRGWIEYPNYPLLSVTCTDVEPDSVSIEISQEPFFADGNGLFSRGNEDDNCPTWWCPLSISSSSSSSSSSSNQYNFPSSLRTKSMKITIPIDTTNGAWWIYINTNRIGFYRVAYDSQLMHQLINHGFDTSLTEEKTKTTADTAIPRKLELLDRVWLLQDLTSLSMAGKAIGGIEMLFNLWNVCAKTYSSTIWEAIVSSMTTVRQLVLDRPDAVSSMGDITRKNLSPIFDSIGRWDPAAMKPEDLNRLSTKEKATLKQLRSVCIGQLSFANSKEVQQEAISRLNLFLEKGNDSDVLSVDYRGIAYMTSVFVEGVERFDDLFARLKCTESQEERTRLIYALGIVNDDERKRNLMDMALGSDIQPQEVPFYVRAVGRTSHGHEIAFEWMKKHWDFLVRKLEGPFLLAGTITTIIAEVMKEETASKIREFVSTTKECEGMKRSLSQSLAKMEIRLKWKQREAKNILQHLGVSISEEEENKSRLYAF